MIEDSLDLPGFQSLTVTENDEGWGPSDMPKDFIDMPYQPFSKDTRLGKVADWCGTIYQDNKAKGRYTSQYGGGAQYAYYHDEDDSSFQIASGGKDNRSGQFRQRFKFQPRGRRGGSMYPGRGGQYTHFNPAGGPNRGQRRFGQERDRMGTQNRRYNNWNPPRRGSGMTWRQNTGDYRRPNRVARSPSIKIEDKWTHIEDLEFNRLSSLSLPSIKEPVDLLECGSVKYFDKSYDVTSTRNEKPLVRFNGVIHAVTTREDPVIQRLARDSAGNVFCTDRMAAAIMCAPRSVDSWDLVVNRIGDKLFFDTRANSNFDYITVAETAAEPPTEDAGHINSLNQLAVEATFINLNFTQQVLEPENTFFFSEKNPFLESEENEEAEKVASVGYRYRRFELGAGVQLVVRCEVDAALPLRKEGTDSRPKFACIKALNEFDSRYCNSVNWRSKLDTQRGAVLACELKNNGCKLHKWTVSSIMAGAEQLKLGFISRVNLKDTSHHVILGVQDFKPHDFAHQINLNMDNAWGILRCIIDYFMKYEPGQYLIFKEPNMAMLRIYRLPTNAFASDESSSDEEQDIPQQQQVVPAVMPEAQK